MFTLNQHILAPCDDKSLVCWPLTDVVENGKDFCNRVGFTVSDLNVEEGMESFIDFLPEVDRKELSMANTDCFEGSSSGMVSVPAFARPQVTRTESDDQYVYMAAAVLSLIVVILSVFVYFRYFSSSSVRSQDFIRQQRMKKFGKQ